MITWKDIIGIIREMFEAKERDIAEHLGVSQQMLSHVKHGRKKPSEQFLEQSIYRKIFSPTESKSLASHDPKYNMQLTSTNGKKVEDSCLFDLKRIIEIKYPDVRADMDEFWDDKDYKAFVIELIKLAKLNTPLKSTPKTFDTASEGSSPAQTDTCPRPGIFHVVRSDSQQEQSSVQIASSNDTTIADPTDADIPPNTVGMGAQLHIEDKYKCCRFCISWGGTMKSTFAICAGYQEPRQADEGKECTYYEPNEAQITAERTRSLLPQMIRTIKSKD